jgi:serine/threonine protein phosphatase PrpC
MNSIRYATLSERGLRATNDDSICAEKLGSYHVFALADGDILRPGGQIASDIAIRCLRDEIRAASGRPPATLLTSALLKADNEIRMESKKSREREGMSTRLSACMIDSDLMCTVLDTGEGGSYFIGSDGIRIPGERVPRGMKPGSGIRASGDWGGCQEMLSHTLGAPRILKESDITATSLRDSILLLNSDGLHDFVKKEKILEIVARYRDNLEAACEALVQQALADESDHTISVILIQGD